MARNVSVQTKTGFTILAWAVALLLFSPILWTILTAFKTEAEAIAAPHSLDVVDVADLHEVDVGSWEGNSWSRIMEEDPDYYRAFMDNPADTPYRDGESYRQVLHRVLPEFDRLLDEQAGRSFAVVAHNVVNRVYAAHLMGLELRLARELRQENCCVNVIRRKSDRTELVTLNAALHLSVD